MNFEEGQKKYPVIQISMDEPLYFSDISRFVYLCRTNPDLLVFSVDESLRGGSYDYGIVVFAKSKSEAAKILNEYYNMEKKDFPYEESHLAQITPSLLGKYDS